MAVAGKGRSLGMHLVFATQSLQGKLSPEMKNNISLRITLRQNEKSDSVEVLGVPDAVTIPGRFKGRGLVLCTLDENRQPRPFQSGYLGDPPPDGRARPARIRLVEWNALGLPRPEARSSHTIRDTDQTQTIAAVEEASERSFLGPVKRPLLPPLPAQLRPEDLRVTRSPGTLPFALADDPENQEQPVVALDLTGTDRWMIAGGPQSGRTTALRALLQSAAALRSDQVQTYVIANRDGELSSFADRPNCGAVMHLGEPDRIRRLVAWLGQEVQRRTRERFTSSGSRPAVVVLVDGWEGLENRGQGLFDETSVLTTLYEVISGGPPVGVHVVVTGGQVMVSGRLPDLYNRRILLAFPSESARRAAMGGAMTPPPHLPGRGIETATGCHVQIAHAGPTITRTVAMPSPGTSPQHFAPMPYEVPVDDRTLWAPATSATWIPVGRGGPQVEPVGVDLFGEDPHLLLISGPEGSGRSTSAAAAVLALRQVGVPVLVIAPPRSPLHRLLGESADLRLLSGTSWADEQLRQAAAPFEGGQYAVVMDDLDQMKVEAGTVNFAPAPTLLDDLADPASAGRRALVLCGNAGPVLDGAVRSLARVVESSVQGGTRLVLSPSSIFAARQMGITLERDQILPVGPGRGFVTVRRAVQPIQAALLPRKSPIKSKTIDRSSGMDRRRGHRRQDLPVRRPQHRQDRLTMTAGRPGDHVIRHGDQIRGDQINMCGATSRVRTARLRPRSGRRPIVVSDDLSFPAHPHGIAVIKGRSFGMTSCGRQEVLRQHHGVMVAEGDRVPGLGRLLVRGDAQNDSLRPGDVEAQAFRISPGPDHFEVPEPDVSQCA
jgi:S-DNA-T family DNA segregation ATPase FtsK/SpoIIIE